jgi:putative oxidoreductase
MQRETFTAEWQPRVLSVLRIVAALMLMQHATMKFLAFPAPYPIALSPLLMVAGAIEAVGSVLLLIGLFTRPVAFVLSGLLAVAYFMAHAPRGLYPIANGGEVAVLYCFIFLYLAFAGGGAWSVDAVRGRRYSVALKAR